MPLAAFQQNWLLWMTPEWGSKSDPKIGFADRASPVLKRQQAAFSEEHPKLRCSKLSPLLRFALHISHRQVRQAHSELVGSVSVRWSKLRPK